MPTYRLVDGERIAGAWRHVWIRGMRGFEYYYYYDDLVAYADGVIKCWETFDLAELRRRLGTGEIAFLAIPAHLRVFVLGDMDMQDIPLRRLITDIGEPGWRGRADRHRGDVCGVPGVFQRQGS